MITSVPAEAKVDINKNLDLSGHNGSSIGLKLAGTLVTATAAELNRLDGAGSGGTAVASKAVIADANQNIGVIKGTALYLGTSGSETQVSASGTELSYLDITTLGTSQNSKVVTQSAGGVVTIGAAAGNQFLDIASHDLVDGGLKLAGTLVTSSAAELNLLDNVTGLVQADLTKLAAVDATAAELNLMDAGTSQGSVTLAGTDGFIINDADDVMKQALISDIPTFVASQTLTGVKIADNGNIGSASATTAITIAGSGAVTLAQRDIHSAGITLAESQEIGVPLNLDLMTLTSAGVSFTGTLTTNGDAITSDARYKKNITPVSDAQDKLSELNPVNYDMRGDEFPTKGFNDKKQWGFIAQEVEKIMPELIHADKDGYRSMNYTGIIPLLTKAVQEQQTEMEKQQKEIDELKAQLELIMKMMQSDMSDKTDDKKADDTEKPVKLSMATVK